MREHEHYGLHVLSPCLLFFLLIKQMSEELYLNVLKEIFSLATQSFSLATAVLNKMGCWNGAAVLMTLRGPMFTHLGNEDSSDFAKLDKHVQTHTHPTNKAF